MFLLLVNYVQQLERNECPCAPSFSVLLGTCPHASAWPSLRFLSGPRENGGEGCRERPTTRGFIDGARVRAGGPGGRDPEALARARQNYVYIYIYIYTYVYIYMYTHISISMYLYIYMSIYLSLSLSLSLSIYIYIYIYIYLYTLLERHVIVSVCLFAFPRASLPL